LFVFFFKCIDIQIHIEMISLVCQIMRMWELKYREILSLDCLHNQWRTSYYKLDCKRPEKKNMYISSSFCLVFFLFFFCLFFVCLIFLFF
jgi:hypothetical protein